MSILDPPSYRKPSGGIPKSDLDTATQASISSGVQKGDLVLNVKDYGATGDGTTDDTMGIRLALAAARSNSGNVYLPAGTYRVTSTIDIKGTNMKILGAGTGKTVITTFGGNSVLGAIFSHTDNVINLTIRDITFKGTIIDDVTGPRRSRTSTSNGFNVAVQLTGALAPNGTYTVKNVLIDRCEVIGSASLPMWLSGVDGDAIIQNSRSELCMDWGWTWCANAICVNNTSNKSSDNGFSVSRGNKRATVSGNIVTMCAYFGIWVSGFIVSGDTTDMGPQNFTVTGNTVFNAGKGGIHADDAPKNGTITGNVVNTVLRGPSDEPTDIWGCGIYIGGFPSNNRTTPTDYAYAIIASNNTLVNCARGGILTVASKHCVAIGNTIINPGSQYAANGTTLIAPNDTNNNFGIAVLTGAQSTVSNFVIHNNTIVDDRTTAYTTYPWYTSGSSRPDVVGNFTRGTLQDANIIHDNANNTIHSGGHVFQTNNTKLSAGATTGSNAGTGQIAGYDTNGAAGSIRPSRWLTAGVERWRAGANGATESGSNAGTDWVLSSYDDAGVALATLITATRKGAISQGVQGQALTINSRIVSGAQSATVAAGSQSASAVAASNGANDIAGTINITTSVSPTAGTLASITFATAYGSTPHVLITPQNLASVQCSPYISSRSSATFIISCATAPSASASLQYDYHVVG